MKAIVYHRYGSPDVLRFEEIEKPTAGDKEVLIKVRAASLNPYDWHFIECSASQTKAHHGASGFLPDRSPIPPPKYSEGAKSIPAAGRIESFKLEIRLPLVGVLQPSATVTAARQLHDFDGLGEAWIARRFDGLMRIHCPPSSTRTWFSAER